MAQKKIFITVLLWVEIIICLRGLFFILPFWLNQYFAGNPGGMKIDDWFMIVVTIAIFLHGLAGLVCFKNFSTGKAFHYVGLMVIMGMTAGLFNLSTKVLGVVNPYFSIPLVSSLIIVAALSLAGRQQG